MNKANETQLEKEISAVKFMGETRNTLTEVKERLSAVERLASDTAKRLDDLESKEKGTPVTLDRAVFLCPKEYTGYHNWTQQIAKETVSQIDSIEALLKGKGII